VSDADKIFDEIIGAQKVRNPELRALIEERMKAGGEVHAANGLPLTFAQDKEDPDALQNWMRERRLGKVDIPAPYKVKPEEVTVARAMRAAPAAPVDEVTQGEYGPRGSAAYYLLKQDRFPDFVKYAGIPADKRGLDFPEDLLTVPGHAYHKTAQATPMQQFIETGEMQMKSPKVPMYIEASGVPETGFQTKTPVGDAHWSRAVGLADTRNPKFLKGKEVVPGASVSNAEMSLLAPWWRDKVAAEVGLESVPAQARAWGLFSPQTGVTTPIGAPKLELMADQAAMAAYRMGISPEDALSMIIRGEGRFGKKRGGAITKSPTKGKKR
jgi:hypothetical protein